MTESRLSGFKRTLQERARNVYRGAILDAAEQLLLMQAPQATKVCDIAEAAGISVGTVYNHFNSKEAILSALIERQRERLFFALSEPYATSDPVEQLQELIRRSIVAAEQIPLAYAELVHRAATDRSDCSDQPTPQQPDAGERQYAALLEQHLRRAIDAKMLRQDCSTEELGWYFCLLLRTAYEQWSKEGRKRPLSDRSDLLVHLFLQGATGTTPLRTKASSTPSVAIERHRLMGGFDADGD